MSNPLGHEPAKNHCAANRRASGRVHLPVAPRALARVRFTPEKPLPRALTPEQALNWIDFLLEEGDEVKVANLGGPGDPLATPELTVQTLLMMRKRLPQVSLCVTTLGFGAAAWAEELAKLQLAHVSILMDAVSPPVAEKIYAWVRPGTRNISLAEGARLLIEEQAAAVQAFKQAGVPVHIKTTVYPGVNDEHVNAIAAHAAELGADEMKLFPYEPVSDDHPHPSGSISSAELKTLSATAAEHLPTQFIDLATCRDVTQVDLDDPAMKQATLPKPSQRRPHLAVCSSNGFDVDLHLGQADQFLIFGPKDGPVVLLGARPAPEAGGAESRWQEVALTLSDCFAVLCAAAGQAPQSILPEKGLSVLIQEGNVEGLVDVLFGGGKKKGKGGGK